MADDGLRFSGTVLMREALRFHDLDPRPSCPAAASPKEGGSILRTAYRSVFIVAPESSQVRWPGPGLGVTPSRHELSCGSTQHLPNLDLVSCLGRVGR